MTTGPENPSELIYKALCLRHRSTTKGSANPMTREKLQEVAAISVRKSGGPGGHPGDASQG